MVSSKVQGSKNHENEMSAEYEQRYAYHYGAGKPVADVKEIILQVNLNLLQT